MPALRVEIRRLIDTSFPGFVECAFVDAHGRVVVIHEKAPVVTERDIDASTKFPVPGVVACEIVGERGDVVRVSTARPWGIAAVDGSDEFDVARGALEDDEHDVVDADTDDVDSDEDLAAV